MQPFLLYSSVLVGVVSAFSAPPHSSDGVTVTSVAGTIESDYVTILLSIPSEQDADALDLTLHVGSAERECLDTGLQLNGQTLRLATEPHSRTKIPISRTDESVAWYEVEGSLICLQGEASLADLLIYDVEQPSNPITQLSFSYQQTSQPSVLKLQFVPAQPGHIDPSPVSSPDALDSWVHPADDEKLTIESNGLASAQTHMPEGLEAQLLRLGLLQAHAAEIEQEIKSTQAQIMVLWKAEFAKCNSLKCYLKTAVAKAPTLAHLFATHLSHHSHINADFLKNQTHMNCTDEVKKVVEQHEKQTAIIDLTEVSTSTEATEESTPDESVDSESEPTASSEETSEGSNDFEQTEDDESSFRNRRPGWRHGPPWARPGGRRPPWATGDKPPFGRPPWARPGGRPPWATGDTPPWATEENPTPAATGPSDHESSEESYQFQPFSLTPQDQFRIAFFIVACIVVGVSAVTLGCCLCIRRKCIFLRDPRRKADCAARREERQTRALYRKAACQHRLRTLFQRFRRPFASSDYEEKRELILGQEGESSDVVRPEINSLRSTHQLVGQMMRAEEGSSSFQYRPRQQTPAELDAAERGSIRSETLPAYSLPPPSYAHDLGSEFSVVDGFTGYTPSATDETLDDTTESSIVDCSPRLSFDSQRTETTRNRD